MNTNDDMSTEVPTGEWVNVPRDMVVAPDTYKDKDGVLRDARDHSCVVWHWVAKGGKRCQRRGIQPHEIVYTDNGAPWCPDCWKKRLAFENEQEQRRIDKANRQIARGLMDK